MESGVILCKTERAVKKMDNWLKELKNQDFPPDDEDELYALWHDK